MSPFIAYHSTVRRYRESIREFGLLTSKSVARPTGVYVFSEDYAHPTFSRGHAVRWGAWGENEVWQVAYIGPMIEDCFVENGIILLERVPPQCLTLITHITSNARGVK